MERQENYSSDGESGLQRRCEGGIHPTDGDGMERSIHEEDDNQMEECHGESETMDYDIHEPHD